jgi:dipeptidyl-peptidase 4
MTFFSTSKTSFCFFLLLMASATLSAQMPTRTQWTADGTHYYKTTGNSLMVFGINGDSTMVLSPNQLTPKDSSQPLTIKSFYFSADYKKVLIYTNSKKVWRLETRGDYWIYDFTNSTLVKMGKSLAASSLMFAKFSPDGLKLAYVSTQNLYVEDILSHRITALTSNGSRKLINGTFDWVYEEEFSCRDGFRWSPDSRSIAFWQINDSSTRDYNMLNTTDSVYSRVIPVEYPTAGQLPSPFRIGVVWIADKKTNWMKIPTDKKLGSYLPRMEWANNSDELIVQRLNRNQNQSDVMICTVKSGDSKIILDEKDSAWIDIVSRSAGDYKMGGWDWLNKGADFLWISEKDGWRHAYRISRDGTKETRITNGDFDIIDLVLVDDKNNQLYFMASPGNATQSYLYRCPLDGNGKAERITPSDESGIHRYEISPDGKFAKHSYSNYFTKMQSEWITLPDHQPVPGTIAAKKPNAADSLQSNISFFTITTADGVNMDGWMQKPIPFDSTKKYPVLFYVYTEPASALVKDQYGVTRCRVYPGDLARDGYIYISLDNRGTPAPKGRNWRKSIYRKIGQVNIQDQAAAASIVSRWSFVDSSRIAVWGWSGGGSATLNLMFQHPEIYKTGIAIAALGNMETYDNIYIERYMGVPTETKSDYEKGSAIRYASGLKGNLLYIHGSGDDNVHFNNAEMLLNELIRYNKTFQFMEYPNRTHAINEGTGTTQHLNNLFKNYLNANCPGGGK